MRTYVVWNIQVKKYNLILDSSLRKCILHTHTYRNRMCSEMIKQRCTAEHATEHNNNNINITDLVVTNDAPRVCETDYSRHVYASQ